LIFLVLCCCVDIGDLGYGFGVRRLLRPGLLAMTDEVFEILDGAHGDGRVMTIL